MTPPPSNLTRLRAELVAALVAVGVVLWGLDAPIVEDGLFWWVPQALVVAETGPQWVLDTLPEAARPQAALPPQWADGLPDYGHPPLWFWWMGLFLRLFGHNHFAVHLAAAPFAALFGVFLAQLGRVVGGERAAWAAVVIPLTPPIAANLLRADTDLPLMCLTPLALWAILTRAEGVFAVTAAIATACKEPGVLLAAPALLANLRDRRLGWGWAWPPLTLFGWAAIHEAETGWALAGSERLPETLGGWLHDLMSVARITLFSQGRWVVWVLAAWALLRARFHTWPLTLLALTALSQIAFFGTLNFLGGLPREDAHTHVRYLLPGMVAALALALSLAPRGAWALLLMSAVYWRRPSDDGPESSLYGIDVALTTRAAAPTLRALDGEVWVGSYAWTQYTRPYAGVVEVPMDSLRVYHLATTPEEVRGWLVETCEGEPLGRLQELPRELHEEVRVGHAWVRIWRVSP
ncbi:glycosyltransferase family 39 protein [Myxococcota bacterium]|nr:glycosyltransferase family 39 protein [Myxococcota bacterium]